MRVVQVTEQVSLYSLEELKSASPAGYEAALEWLRDYNRHYEWYEFTLETWQEALDEIGFENPDIQFRLAYCQGDGASFTSDIDLTRMAAFMAEDIPYVENREQFVDVKTWVVDKAKCKITDPKFRKLASLGDYFTGKVVRGMCNYVHENTCHAEIDFDLPGEWDSERFVPDHPKTHQLCVDFAEAVESLREDLSRAIYSDLDDDYTYLGSDECLLETAEGMEFDISGERQEYPQELTLESGDRDKLAVKRFAKRVSARRRINRKQNEND